MKDKFFLRLIYIISAVVFLLVVFLFQLPKSDSIPEWVKILPLMNSFINGTCTVLLLTSYYFIKQKKVYIHRRLNITTFILSTFFLLSYVTFHSFGVETKFGDVNHDGVIDAIEKTNAGALRYIYFFILITHIVLAAVVLPLVLISLYRGLTGQIAKHKKITRWSFPIWLYVTSTGVIVYILISPYYNF